MILRVTEGSEDEAAGWASKYRVQAAQTSATRDKKKKHCEISPKKWPDLEDVVHEDADSRPRELGLFLPPSLISWGE